MKYKLLIVKKSLSNRGNEMGISELSNLDGRLLHTFFDLKILGRLRKSKALLLKVKIHLDLRIDFLRTSLGWLINLVSTIFRAIYNLFRAVYNIK